jgi:hypothetical protein
MPAGRPPTPSEAISAGGLLDIPNAFSGPSWDRWRAVLKAAWGEQLTAEQETLFCEVAERDPPTRQVKELWCKVGRSGGKDAIASAIATVAALRSYATRRPGEKTLIACIAVDRTQAEIVFDYITSYFQHVPALNALVLHDPRARKVVDQDLSDALGRKMYVLSTSDNTLDLTNGARIVVSTNSFRSIRGRSLICAILDEVAFYRSEESANPDKELYDALEPSLARVPGSILIGISSPYRRSGLLYDKWRRSYGKDDPDCLVVQGPTRLFNPDFPQSIIDRRYEEDPEAAASEYGAQFRTDLADFVSRQAVEACIEQGCHERAPARAAGTYRCFIDAAGGSGGDSMTLAIAHLDGSGTDRIPTLDAIRERKPPFSPSDVVAEFAGLMKFYHISNAVSDKWGGDWVGEAFRKYSITVEPSAEPKADIYRELLPLLNAHRCSLLDHPRLIAQLCGLERKVSRGGKDSIDHARDGHDDIANAVGGALVLCGGWALIRTLRWAWATAIRSVECRSSDDTCIYNEIACFVADAGDGASVRRVPRSIQLRKGSAGFSFPAAAKPRPKSARDRGASHAKRRAPIAL